MYKMFGSTSWLNKNMVLDNIRWEDFLGLEALRGYAVYVGVYLMLSVYHTLWLPLCLFAPAPVQEEMQCMFAYTFWSAVSGVVMKDIQVEVYGDELVNEQSALVLTNHMSRLDYAVISQLAQQSAQIPAGKANFFIWKRRVKVPDMKLWYNILNSTQNWSITAAQVTKQFQPVVKSASPYWTVVFPEVDVNTPALYAKNVAYCTKIDAPVYNNLLAPRFPAFVQAMAHLKSSGGVDWVYDLTVMYWLINDDGSRTYKPPSIQDVLFTDHSKRWVVEVYAKKHAIKNLPTKPHGLQKWLEKAWVSKDTFIKKRIKKVTKGKAKVEN